MLFEIYLSECEVEIAEWGIAYGLQKKISIKQKESNSYILLEGNNLIKKLKIKQ